jgi:hypothetical protein
MNEVLERFVAESPWLWINPLGHLSCGAASCQPATSENGWHVLNPVELAELAALAQARRSTLRCQCGAVEYDPASRTVRERS